MSYEKERQHQRYSFRPGMWVKVLRPGQGMDESKTHQLIDLSQGGISFKSETENEYQLGDEIFILESESDNMKAEIKAVVRHIKPLDEFAVDFKVGVEFVEKI